MPTSIRNPLPVALSYLLWMLFLLSPVLCPAVAVRLPALEQLSADSDLIVIVRAIDTTPTSDLLNGSKGYKGLNTRLAVLAVLKSTGEKPEKITLLHFDYSGTGEPIVNGCTFMSFVTTPVPHERPESAVQRRHEEGQIFEQIPLYIAFLKKRPDGRFEPTGGQPYSDFSFRVVQPWRPEFELPAVPGL